MKKLSILFQEPIVPREVSYGKFSKEAGNNTFPYGVACLASYVEERGYEVKYLEPNLDQLTEEDYVGFIRAGNFDVIGIGSTTLQIEFAIECFNIIKKILPDIITVLGGVHATLLPEETIVSAKSIDYIIAGEGETPFYQLLEAIHQKRPDDCENIQGICYKREGNIIYNPPDSSKYISTEEIPLPLFKIFPMRKYIPQITFAKDFPTYSVMASRGCPYKCSFCNATTISGRRVRYKSIPKVIEEVRILKYEYGARGVMFLDSTFPLNKKWVNEFCRQYIQSGLNVPWSCNTRGDTVDTDILKIMKKAGCWGVNLGIESGNQKSLNLIKKDITVEQNSEAVRLLRKNGYFVGATYIICLPGETEEDVMRTIEYARNLGNQMAFFYLPVPFPRSRLEDACRKDGGLKEDARWLDYNAWCFQEMVYVNPLIGKERMLKLLNKAHVRFYSNPKVILRNFLEVILLRQNPYKYWIGLKGVIRSMFQ